MKPRQIRWKWLLLGMGALLLAGLAILPRQFGNSSGLADRVTEVLSAWSGGEVKLTGPLRMSYFPDVAIRSGFELSNASRFPLVKSISAKDIKISIDLAQLVLGRIRVDAMRLLRPEITLKDVPSLVMGPDQTLHARVANLLSGAPIGVIRLRDGTLHVPTASGTEQVRKIDVRLDASAGDGSLSSSGSFAFREENVKFALDCGAPVAIGESSRIPITLKMNSEPLKAKVAGIATLDNGLQIDGDLKVGMDNVRRFLAWTGIPLPHGRSLRRLSASGPAHWNGTTLTLDDGAFALDGNMAVGLLAITPGPRPRIEGTLDFDRLVLDPYLNSDADAAAPSAAQPALSDQAILKHFDADLRISAAEILAVPLRLGRGGFTISAKGGLLASEIGELELCGGQAGGRIGLDMREEIAKVALTINIADMPVESCLKPMEASFPLSGIGSLRAEASGKGRSYEDLVQALDGSLKAGARGGVFPVDLVRLLSTSAPLDSDGWSRAAGTLFDQLNADCRLAGGQLRCDAFNMRTRRGVFSGVGFFDLARQTLDWDLFLANDAQPLKASQFATESPPHISITGPLSQPMIRRGDRPTLGDGSNPAINQISPR